MIKTLITISVIVAFIVIILGFSDIFAILLRTKGYMIFMISLFWSRLATFSILAYFAYDVIYGFLKKI